jgi:hypothetical protein
MNWAAPKQTAVVAMPTVDDQGPGQLIPRLSKTAVNKISKIAMIFHFK